MSSKLNQDIVSLFKSQFENDCIALLIDAYNSLKKSGRNIVEESENNITAQLVGYMKENPKRLNLQIYLARESYYDSQEIYNGLSDADNAPRIDIKYCAWNSNNEIEFYMEAKNLAETNWTKKTSGVTVDANSLRKRYIETGIENFTSGRYPGGCLLGYVLEGKIIKIIELLNQILKKNKRDKELLSEQNYSTINYHYISNHTGTSSPILRHFFLNLSC